MEFTSVIGFIHAASAKDDTIISDVITPLMMVDSINVIGAMGDVINGYLGGCQPVEFE